MATFDTGYESRHWHLDRTHLKQVLEGIPSTDCSLVKLLDELYREFGRQHAPSAKRWGDKTTEIVPHLNKLCLVFPTAKFIHIVRDGRDCVISAIEAGFFGKSTLSAAYEWRKRVRRIRNTTADEQRCEIRYEDLVTAPRAEIARLCRFLGIEATASMMEFGGAPDLADVAAIPHHRNVRCGMFTSSIERWKGDLPAATAREVSKIMLHELSYYGYR